MDLEFFLIGMRFWDFLDKESGRNVKGGSLIVGQQASKDDVNACGYVVSELPIDSASLTEIKSQVDKFSLSTVLVNCRIQARGKNFKPVALSLQSA